MYRTATVSRSLLVFAVVVLVSTFGVGFPARADAAQNGTPTADLNTAEVLLMTTTARDQLPAGDGFILIGRETLAPGAHSTCTCPDEQGTVVIVIESGTLTYTLGQGGRIIRSANSASAHEETAAPSTAFMLSAGDAVIFPGKKRILDNSSAADAVYLFALILAPVGPPEADPTDTGVRTTEILGVVPGNWKSLQADPVIITFRRASLAAGESLPVPAGGIRAVVSSIAQDPATPTALVANEDGETTNGGVTSLNVLVVTIESGSFATPAA